jgi:hypothetical protein
VRGGFKQGLHGLPSKSTLANPIKHFRAGKCIAEVDFIFIEPQPYNFQVQWMQEHQPNRFRLLFQKGAKPSILTAISSDILLYGGTTLKQRLILEQADYTLTASVSGALFPLVVTGEIDDIEAVTVNSAAIGVTEAAYFLRNGTLNVS